MLEELEKSDFHNVKHLFIERTFINIFRSHLERTPIPKKVFVDNIDNPHTAIIIAIPQLFFGGRADNKEFNRELKKILYETLLLEFKEKDFMEIDCYFSNRAWEEEVNYILKDPYLYNRYYYEINELKLKNWRELVPEDYNIEPIDLSLLSKDYLKNYGWLIEEIKENWVPFEEGLKEKRGFYLVKENSEIVSWCTTEYLTEDNCIEVGIATREEYQGRGFASIVGSATAEYCLSKYKSLGWHCLATNIGSYKTAEKIGYERVREYKKAAAYINQVDNWVVNAFLKVQVDEYKEAIKWYEKVVDAANKETLEFIESYYVQGDFLAKIYFRMSVFYCILGDMNATTQYLEKVVESGLQDEAQIFRDDLLKSLHGTDEWNKIIQLLRHRI
ncbi:MAG: GNAT family N-acetyltransferase [Candidatus Thorarchaeota archaeon]